MTGRGCSPGGRTSPLCCYRHSFPQTLGVPLWWESGEGASGPRVRPRPEQGGQLGEEREMRPQGAVLTLPAGGAPG